jgi:hypothetical protein
VPLPDENVIPENGTFQQNIEIIPFDCSQGPTNTLDTITEITPLSCNGTCYSTAALYNHYINSNT